MRPRRWLPIHCFSLAATSGRPTSRRRCEAAPYNRRLRSRCMSSRSITLLLVTGAVGLALIQAAYSQAPTYDLVIRNGRVVDGTGSPWFLADVGIKGDTIAAVQPRLEAGGARVIDAQGQVVSPGFVDVHAHVEAGDEGQDMVGNPAAENNVRQGVTTVIGAPDGGGSVQVGAYFAKVEAAKPAINVGSFIGHGAVRGAVVGQANRAATPEELEKMRELI